MVPDDQRVSEGVVFVRVVDAVDHGVVLTILRECLLRVTTRLYVFVDFAAAAPPSGPGGGCVGAGAASSPHGSSTGTAPAGEHAHRWQLLRMYDDVFSLQLELPGAGHRVDVILLPGRVRAVEDASSGLQAPADVLASAAVEALFGTGLREEVRLARVLFARTPVVPGASHVSCCAHARPSLCSAREVRHLHAQSTIGVW